MWKKMMKAALGAVLVSTVYGLTDDQTVQAQTIEGETRDPQEIVSNEQERLDSYLGSSKDSVQDAPAKPEENTSLEALNVSSSIDSSQKSPNLKASDENFQARMMAEPTASVAEQPTATTPEISGAAEDLIISEYVEGSANNKAIEIYNGTADDVDLSQYSLKLFTNGKTEAQSTHALSGTLAAGQVYVISNSQAGPAIADKSNASSAVANFNGDDHIQLLKNEVLIDNIGHFGARTNNLKDVTLVRKPEIIAGNTMEAIATDIQAEWIEYAKDDFSHLGQHTMVKAPATLKESLLFSSIIEGSANNKAIEIYNGTGQAVDLGDYSVELYSNANTSPTSTLTLEGRLEDGQYYLISHGKADIPELLELADLKNQAVTNFNGDDTVVLKHKDQIIDSFGQIKDRTNYNKDQSLYRKADVLSGDTNIEDSLDPTIEWDVAPKDDVSGLGKLISSSPAPSTDPNPDTTNPNQDNPKPAETLETITIAEARQLANGQKVQVAGQVNGILKNTVHFEDATGGLAIHPADSVNVQLGDHIVVQGVLADYNGLQQIQKVEVISQQPGDLPTARVTSGQDVNEENESRLDELSQVNITSIDGQGSSWTNYKASADGQDFLIRDERNELSLQVGQTYDRISGIIQQFNADYQILPRGKFDIVQDASVTQAPFANVPSGLVPTSTVIELETLTPGAKIYYTLDGSQPTSQSQLYQAPIVLSETGDVLIQAIASHPDLKDSPVQVFNYQVYDQAQGLNIHHIQGASHQSPLINQRVENIRGIVTAQYTIGSSVYVHMQNPDDQVDQNPNTSEAIVVYIGTKSNHPSLAKGDLIEVSGTVDEYWIDGFWSDMKEQDLPVTQINAREDKGGSVKVISKENPLPTAIVIESVPAKVSSEGTYHGGFASFDRDQYALDYWESLEGMRVAITEGIRTVAPQEHGDLWAVKASQTPETQAGGVLLKADDVNTEKIAFKPFPNRDNNGENGRNFDVITGDFFHASADDPITGVVMYDFGHYKIYNELADMKKRYQRGSTQPQSKTNMVQAKDKLTVAVYNLENYSANTASKETPEVKAQRLANAIGVVMNTPDIVGLTEVQDNDGQGQSGSSAADQSYQRLINDIEKLTGVKYRYLNIDPEYNVDGGAPHANIRVGFLYNPDRVTPIEAPQGGAWDAVQFDGENLSLNPGRIDPKNEAFNRSRKPLAAEFTFNETQDDVIVIVNHWNSKGGDNGIYGQVQPPVLSSQVQREKQAQAVANFVKAVQEKKPQANIVAVGDFNDFQWSKPLQILDGAGMTNMVNQVDPSHRYSYVYNGNSQTLDHAFVSDHLADQTDIEMLKINADFTDMSGRASDHDPIILQIDFGLAETPGQGDQTPPSKEEEPTPQPDPNDPTVEQPGQGEQTPPSKEEEPTPQPDPNKPTEEQPGQGEQTPPSKEEEPTPQPDPNKPTEEQPGQGEQTPPSKEEEPTPQPDSNKPTEEQPGQGEQTPPSKEEEPTPQPDPNKPTEEQAGQGEQTPPSKEEEPTPQPDPNDPTVEQPGQGEQTPPSKEEEPTPQPDPNDPTEEQADQGSKTDTPSSKDESGQNPVTPDKSDQEDQTDKDSNQDPASTAKPDQEDQTDKESNQDPASAGKPALGDQADKESNQDPALAGKPGLENQANSKPIADVKGEQLADQTDSGQASSSESLPQTGSAAGLAALGLSAILSGLGFVQMKRK